jgi:hypothetical protein
MILNAYTDDQIRTVRVLLESIEVKGYENCKKIVMLKEIIENLQRVEVSENVEDVNKNVEKEGEHGEEIEDKSDRKRSRLHKSA